EERAAFLVRAVLAIDVAAVAAVAAGDRFTAAAHEHGLRGAIALVRAVRAVRNSVAHVARRDARAVGTGGAILLVLAAGAVEKIVALVVRGDLQPVPARERLAARDAIVEGVRRSQAVVRGDGVAIRGL